MNAKQLFFERYDGFREYPEHLIAGLTAAQIRQSPQPALNPIAWTLWHLARCEDVCVNRILSDQSQVLDDDGRSKRLRVAERSVGTGMAKDDVLALSAAIDLSELDLYRKDVSARTVATLESISTEDLAHDLDPQRLRQVLVTEQAGGAVGDQIVAAYSGHTKGWLLGHLVLTHHFYHIGQAFGVRVLHGAQNPW